MTTSPGDKLTDYDSFRQPNVLVAGRFTVGTTGAVTLPDAHDVTISRVSAGRYRLVVRNRYSVLHDASITTIRTPATGTRPRIDVVTYGATSTTIEFVYSLSSTPGTPVEVASGAQIAFVLEFRNANKSNR